MTLEESKELEVKVANDILNNIQFSSVVQLISTEAQARAKRFISEATEEELNEVKKKVEEAEAKAKAESEKAKETEKPNEE
jgi:cell fate regulator YaaT (PSP1 superfamily)